ncbi:uncharacterized protein BDR25DRAFT_349320 [Lindgomyces ingoldianus]|uniref:Uncharacterized protein n=1 Tax=Lindgomyces ingoldianus TaxID=673940 RepID=A0ACB6RBS7_9PLEO|nr:uncharacterized protein BDR25DRAFT_349320 [Lindgomyces ingoldianus]KAF2476198.1 hypothetical protein BDR25DRAFT_349320 [Lindgomyces ingoldianus]
MLKLQARGATRSTSVLLVAQARELMPQSIYGALHALATNTSLAYCCLAMPPAAA